MISRPQLLAIGVTRGQVRAQVEARRWRRCRTQCIAVQTGALSELGELWAALLEAGPRAVLDGASSLRASGLKGFDEEAIRISVPKSARRRRGPGINVHQTRRYRVTDQAASGVPRTKPAVAAVHGALWARSDKQAVLLLTMAVQQGLTTAEHLGAAALRVRRDRRRLLIHATVLDLLDGVRSISEQEFARACRERGIPEPSRQVRRRTKDGRYFLDVYWDEWGVVVEIDGIQHGWVQNAVAGRAAPERRDPGGGPGAAAPAARAARRRRRLLRADHRGAQVPRLSSPRRVGVTSARRYAVRPTPRRPHRRT